MSDRCVACGLSFQCAMRCEGDRCYPCFVGQVIPAPIVGVPFTDPKLEKQFQEIFGKKGQEGRT